MDLAKQTGIVMQGHAVILHRKTLPKKWLCEKRPWVIKSMWNTKYNGSNPRDFGNLLYFLAIKHLFSSIDFCFLLAYQLA